MTTAKLQKIAARVDAAAASARAIAQLTPDEQLSVDEAYEVQKASIARRLTRGERLAGVKMSLTSRAKMLQVGPWGDPTIDVGNLGIIVEANGRPVEIGSSAAILGHPVRSLVAAARMVARAGETLEPGWIVLAGGATAACALTAGMHVRTVIERLGAVSLVVEA